jgi:hypothetical protein
MVKRWATEEEVAGDEVAETGGTGGAACAAPTSALPASMQARRHGVNHGDEFTIILTEVWCGPAGIQPDIGSLPLKPNAQGSAPRNTAVSGE